MTVTQFTGMKVFSTTLARDREAMGDNITRWITETRSRDRRQDGDAVERQGVPLRHDHALYRDKPRQGA
jgi:hypothetical protein